MSTNAAAPRLVSRRRRSPGGNRLTMRRGVPLRDAVLGGFSRIVAYARSAARRVSADPIESVHDFRKSVRRARAVVSLLRPSLGKTATAGVTQELRRVFGPTGALRDTHIRADTLRDFPPDDPARDEILRALEEEAAGESAPAGKVLDAGSRILQPLPRVLEVTLPRAYAMDDLARGVAPAAGGARGGRSNAPPRRASTPIFTSGASAFGSSATRSSCSLRPAAPSSSYRGRPWATWRRSSAVSPT